MSWVPTVPPTTKGKGFRSPPCCLWGGVWEWKVMPPLLWYAGWGVGVEGEGLRWTFAWHVEGLDVGWRCTWDEACIYACMSCMLTYTGACMPCM